MLCYRCGSYMPDGSRQCEACGEPLRGVEDSPTSKISGLRLPFAEGDVLADRYRVTEPLGVGAAGWVVRAEDVPQRRTVAVKIIAANLLQTERDRQIFVGALRTYRELADPNRVPVLDEGREKNHVFYVMPELSGVSLRKLIDDRLQHQRLFRWPELVPLLQQLVAALQGLGALGAHGALRPHNIVLSPDRLMVTGGPHWHGLPRRPFVVGQAAYGAQYYLAPEARGDGAKLNGRADVFSIAVLVTEMLTGALQGRDAHVWRVAKTTLPDSVSAALRRNAAEPLQARAVSPAHFLEELVTASELTERSATEPVLSWQEAQTVLVPHLPVRPAPSPSPPPPPRLAHQVAMVVLLLGFLVSLGLWLQHAGWVDTLRGPPPGPDLESEDADGETSRP